MPLVIDQFFRPVVGCPIDIQGGLGSVTSGYENVGVVVVTRVSQTEARLLK